MLVLLGANHRSAPLAIRERMNVTAERIPGALDRLRAYEGVCEAMILSTCNRAELLVRSEAGEAAGTQALRRFLTEEQGITVAEMERYTYEHVSSEAVQHLFRVASGLDSMIIGEPQILGQVKQAYRQAREHRTTGVVLDRLMQHCLATAKRVRSSTGISRHAVSVAFAAVELACKIFGKLEGRTALLLGAGKMSDLLARHLMSNGVGSLLVTSRTYNHAVASAERFGGRPIHWDDGLAGLGKADIVVSCTGAPRVILTKNDVARALRGRRGGPLFLIDIAVPRDVDPAVNELDNVYLYDIDALQNVVDSNLEERENAAALAQKLIREEVDAFSRWRDTQELAPTIIALRERLLTVGRGELERFRGKLGALTSDQERTVEHLTRALIQKILHPPIRHLRNSVERGDMVDCISLYQQIFDLHASDSPDDNDRAKNSEEQAPRAGPQRIIEGGKDH